MIRIAVEVSGGGGDFRVMIQAESIERAVTIANSRYLGREVRVLFPIDPEAFFAGNRGPREMPVLVEMSEAAG